MNYNEKWKKIEVRADKKKGLIKKKFVDTLTGFSLSDFIIINQWLNYANETDTILIFSKNRHFRH